MSIHTLPQFRLISVFVQSILFFFGGEPPLKVAGGRPWRLRDYFGTIFVGCWSPLGVPRGALWGSCWRMFCEIDPFKYLFRVILSDSEKISENGAPHGGVDMQSAHACACFVRVGRCRLGSMSGSILR